VSENGTAHARSPYQLRAGGGDGLVRLGDAGLQRVRNAAATRRGEDARACPRSAHARLLQLAAVGDLALHCGVQLAQRLLLAAHTRPRESEMRAHRSAHRTHRTIVFSSACAEASSSFGRRSSSAACGHERQAIVSAAGRAKRAATQGSAPCLDGRLQLRQAARRYGCAQRCLCLLLLVQSAGRPRRVITQSHRPLATQRQRRPRAC
jgi:hypothetical protein